METRSIQRKRFAFNCQSMIAAKHFDTIVAMKLLVETACLHPSQDEAPFSTLQKGDTVAGARRAGLGGEVGRSLFRASLMMKRGEAVARPCFFDLRPQAVLEYWKAEDPSFIQWLAAGGLGDLEFVLPLLFHEDAVPRWRGDTGTFWSWSTPLSSEGPWVSRNCVVGLATTSIAPRTRRAILDVLAWDMDALRRGFFPSHDHVGRKFEPDTPEFFRAGQRIAGSWRACLAGWKGDQEASVFAHEPWFMSLVLQDFWLSCPPAQDFSVSFAGGSHQCRFVEPWYLCQSARNVIERVGATLCATGAGHRRPTRSSTMQAFLETHSGGRPFPRGLSQTEARGAECWVSAVTDNCGIVTSFLPATL